MAGPLDALRMFRQKLLDDSAQLNPNGVRQTAPQTRQDGPDAPIAWPPAPSAPKGFGPPPEPGTPNVAAGGDVVANDDAHPLLHMDNTPQVLEGLRAAQGPSDMSKLYGLQTKLHDEIEGNLAKARGAGSAYMTGATPVDVQTLDRDLAESPVTQYQGQKRMAADQQFQAGQQGFGSPQQAAQFGRGLETAKANSPAEVAKINAQGNLDVQNAREKGSDSFFDRLMQMRGAGIDPGTVIRGPGGMQFSTAAVSPGAASNAEKSVEQLTKELNALENPSRLLGIPLQDPTRDTQALITSKRAELAAALARATGRPVPAQTAPSPAPAPSAGGRPAGTRGTVNGVPAIWDGQGWLPEGR